MAIKIQNRYDTTLNWETYNPILAVGEVGYDTDRKKTKIGDGTTPWNSLEYQAQGVTGATGTPDYTLVVKKEGDGMTGTLAVGATGNHPSAQFEVTSTAKGFLPPRMSTVQRDAIVNPAEGLTIYNTDIFSLENYNGFGWSVPGGDITWDGGTSVASSGDKIIDGGYA